MREYEFTIITRADLPDPERIKMLEKYEPYLPKTFKGYCEPFLGGGAMFLWAYNKNPNAEFILNDINEPIINIYRAIKNDCDKFCSVLDSSVERPEGM